MTHDVRATQPKGHAPASPRELNTSSLFSPSPPRAHHSGGKPTPARARDVTFSRTFIGGHLGGGEGLGQHGTRHTTPPLIILILCKKQIFPPSPKRAQGFKSPTDEAGTDEAGITLKVSPVNNVSLQAWHQWDIAKHTPS